MCLDVRCDGFWCDGLRCKTLSMKYPSHSYCFSFNSFVKFWPNEWFFFLYWNLFFCCFVENSLLSLSPRQTVAISTPSFVYNSPRCVSSDIFVAIGFVLFCGAVLLLPFDNSICSTDFVGDFSFVFLPVRFLDLSKAGVNIVKCFRLWTHFLHPSNSTWMFVHFFRFYHFQLVFVFNFAIVFSLFTLAVHNISSVVTAALPFFFGLVSQQNHIICVMHRNCAKILWKRFFFIFVLLPFIYRYHIDDQASGNCEFG